MTSLDLQCRVGGFVVVVVVVVVIVVVIVMSCFCSPVWFPAAEI